MEELNEFVFEQTTFSTSPKVDVNLNEMNSNKDYATENFSDDVVSIGETYTISSEYDHSCSIKSEISETSQTSNKNWTEDYDSNNEVHVDSPNTSETSMKSLEAKIDRLEKEIKSIKYTLQLDQNEQRGYSKNFNLQNKNLDIIPKNRIERNQVNDNKLILVFRTKSPMTSLYAKKPRSKSLPNYFPNTSPLDQISTDQLEKALFDEDLQRHNFYNGQKYFVRNSMDNILNQTKDILIDKKTNDVEFKLIENMPMNQYKFRTGRSMYRNFEYIGNKEYKNNSTQTDLIDIEIPISPQRSNILKNNHALSSASESKLISQTHKPEYNFSKLYKNSNYPSHIPIAIHYLKVGDQKGMANRKLKLKRRKSAIPIRSTSNRCSMNSINLDANIRISKSASKEHVSKDVGMLSTAVVCIVSNRNRTVRKTYLRSYCINIE